MKIQNKLALIAEGLYYQTRQYKKDLNTVLKPMSHKGDISRPFSFHLWQAHQ